MVYALLAQLAAAQETPAREDAAAAAIHTPQPPAEVIFDLLGLPVTNTIFTAWVVIAFLVLFAFFTTRNLRLVPSGMQNFWEVLVEAWLGLVEQMMGRRGRRFLPLILTSFLFVLFSNWLGILPFVGNVTIRNPEGLMVPLFRSANSDLNVTASMAVIAIVVAEVAEFRSLGAGGYLKGLLIPNPTRWLEMITRPLSLSLRLFGNIFAGDVLVVTMLGVAPFAVFAFLGLEVFVGFIQALIFAMLTLVFLTIATMHSRDEHHDSAAHAAPADERGGMDAKPGSHAADVGAGAHDPGTASSEHGTGPAAHRPLAEPTHA